MSEMFKNFREERIPIIILSKFALESDVPPPTLFSKFLAEEAEFPDLAGRPTRPTRAKWMALTPSPVYLVQLDGGEVGKGIIHLDPVAYVLLFNERGSLCASPLLKPPSPKKPLTFNTSRFSKSIRESGIP
ncbi:hypothetical protein NHQ30_002783 [Ciborinia camelliae]|nr:hypothetical protein NHQ30_002783 [Ciborinia camelliae]